MQLLLPLPALFLATTLLPLLSTCAVTANQHVVPHQAIRGPVSAQFASTPQGLDHPYLSGINASVFEWWWFEAVAQDLQTSLTAIFFTTSGAAFPLSADTNREVTTVFVSARLPNGSIYYNELPASAARISSGGALGNAARGDWSGTGATFAGTPDLARYTVAIDSPAAGIKGSVELCSTAPAHYTCTADLAAGQPLQVFPHVGWSNAQPAALASGSFDIGGQKLDFDGALGYHDHNWGDAPFDSLIKSWYWGHTRLGPYTVVWFDGIDSKGVERVAAYAAKDDEILKSCCTSGSVRVRPFGKNAVYPPQPGKGSKFEYLEVTMELGGGKLLKAKVVPASVNLNAKPIYTRWIGRATGGVVGEAQYEGVAAFEEFTIS